VRQLSVLVICSLLLAGCATVGYRLVPPGQVRIAKTILTVRPDAAWNKVTGLPPGEEIWTRNGPLIDSITFVVGLHDGAAIVRQTATTDRQVPVFHADMSPDDLATMIESYYRISLEARVFKTTRVAPIRFLGSPGMQLDYEYTEEDEVRRRGCAVLGVHDGKLYLLMLNGTALHYFEAELPEFQAIVSSASIS
jgi:hypothetical protein